MIGRNKRGSRQASLKVRLGVAAAVLAGGSAVGVAAVAASHHSTTTTAQSAGFTLSFHHHISEQAALSTALTTWSQSQNSAMTTLANMAPMRTFAQVWHHRTQFAAQRGVVVLATKKFLLVKSANGGLHLWWINGMTQFQNVTGSATGMVAMTGSNMAAFNAMATNNMAPAATVMAGSTAAVNQMAAPVAKPTTLTIDTGNQVITITITNSTATVTQPATTSTPVASTTPTPSASPTALPTMTPVPTPTATSTMPVTMTTQGVARGDLVFVAGIRRHGFLIAKLVLFAVPPTGMPTASPTASVTMTGLPTATPTMTGAPAPAPTGTATFSGTHS